MDDHESHVPPGVYEIAGAADAVTLPSGEPIPPGYVIATIDGNVAVDRESFFTEIARALHFPAYFGRNWDAVYDCLTDPSLIPAEGCVIVIDGYSRFAAAQPEQWEIARQVFSDACAFWRPLSRPLYVLLRAS